MTDLKDGPADTRIMGIVHSALRRDLCRARLVLEGGPIDGERRKALAGHLAWMMDFLHRHHSAEDDSLYPLVRERDPSIGPLLDRMDAEHGAVHPAMDAVLAGAAAFGERGDRSAALAAVVGLEAVLLPHLEHEERELMPIVSELLSNDEWRRLDDKMIKGKSPRALALEGHWLIDNLDDEGRQVVVGSVPPVPRFVLVRLLGGPYRRLRTTMWAGTPAEAVPSLSLEPTC